MSVLDQIRAHAAARPPRIVDVPEWGLEGVRLKPLTLAQFARINREANEGRKMARLLIHAMHDAEGKPVLEENAETMAVLMGTASIEVVTRIAQEIMATVPDEAEAKNG